MISYIRTESFFQITKTAMAKSPAGKMDPECKSGSISISFVSGTGEQGELCEIV
jgi:hypothetical protein